jgi:hypothetical protein
MLVDEHWVARLVEAFDAAPDVACVTGAILPAEQETQAQLWLEEYSGFHKGFGRQVFDLTMHRRDTPLYPYDAGQFGSGATGPSAPTPSAPWVVSPSTWERGPRRTAVRTSTSSGG